MTREAVEADYRQLREHVGAFRLGRDVVRVAGPDAPAYLQGQCSQDLDRLEPGRAADTLLLAPDGKLEVLARVVRLEPEVFHFDVDAGYGERLAERLRRFKLRSKLEIEALDWECVALRGPATPGPDALRADLVAGFEWDGWTGVDLLGPRGSVEVPESVPWCASPAYEAARIESGVPVMGRELLGGEIPAETGTVSRAVSFTKGCFTGQELVARIDSRGGSAPRRLVGIVLDHDTDTDADALVGAELFVAGGGKAAGRVTSAAWCPGIDALGALGYAHRSVEVPGRVRVVAPGADPSASPAAEVRSLPLV